MSWHLALTIASIIPAIALWTYLRRKTKKLPDGVKPMSALPGPPALPIVGNLTQLLGYKRPQTHIVWTKWARQYGKLYRVNMPGQTFVVVADPALLPSVLGRPGLPKSRVYELGFFLATKTFHDTMFSIRHTTDLMWKATRKTLAQAFTSEAIRSKMPLVVDRSLGLSEKLRKYGPSREIEVQDAMARITLDVIMATGFDLPSDAVDLDKPCPLLEDMHFLMAETFRGFTNPFRKLYRQLFPGSQLAQRFSSKLANMHSIWHKIMTDVLARGKVDAEDNSLWGCLSRVEDLKTGKPLSGDLLQAEVAGIILGGLDTTAQTCAFTLALLAAHPEKPLLLAKELDRARLLATPKRVEPRGMLLDVLQERLRHHDMNMQRLRALTTPVRRALLAAHPEKAQLLAEELDRAGLLATPERPEPRGMVFSDLLSLTYLDGVLKESLRMFPVAATGLSRCTDGDCVLGGYHIPAGTEVQVPIYTLHMLTFPDPECFRPERWTSKTEVIGSQRTMIHAQAGAPDCDAPIVSDESTSVKAGSDKHSSSCGDCKPAQTFIAFSSGPRDCLGQRLAMMEAATIIATIFGRFTFELAPRMGGFEGLLERQTIAFTLAVDDGLWIRFIPRCA